MKLSGHKTASVFGHYDAGSDSDLVEAARKRDAIGAFLPQNVASARPEAAGHSAD
jgi:flagellar biosynthesis/type III secretory pathway ATPase